MIIPQPEADLTLNIMVMATDIIKLLRKKNEYMVADDLMKKYLKFDKRRTPEMFFNVVTYLYTLGIIKEKNYKIRFVWDDTKKNLE